MRSSPENRKYELTNESKVLPSGIEFVSRKLGITAKEVA